MYVRNVKLIKRLMASENISARQLAAGIGYRSHSYVNRILAGDIVKVTPDRARKIARFLKVDLDDLFVSTTSTPTRRSAKTRKAS